jgi:hypothetical protein
LFARQKARQLTANNNLLLHAKIAAKIPVAFFMNYLAFHKG